MTEHTSTDRDPSIPVFASGFEDVARRAYCNVMAAWPIAHEELTITTRFGDTHVIASGPAEAPAIVLLHALFATATSWYRNVEGLSASHRTYCVDVIGEANESRPTRPIESLDDFLSWFQEVIDGLGIDGLALIGNSYGGFTAAYYAMKLPDRVRKLVLVGPAATIHPMRPFMYHMFLPKGVYMAAPRLPGQARVMRRAVDWMHAGLPADPLWEPLFTEIMEHGRLINRVFPRIYSRSELEAIQAPVLLVFGDREVIYGNLESAIGAGRRLLPDADVAVIPDAHHIAALANPVAANDAFLRFLAD